MGSSPGLEICFIRLITREILGDLVFSFLRTWPPEQHIVYDEDARLDWLRNISSPWWLILGRDERVHQGRCVRIPLRCFFSIPLL